MTREIKFTSFGVPYILEFQDVSVVPERAHASPSSSTSSFCYIDTPPPQPRPSLFSLPSPSSLFKRKHSAVPPEPALWSTNSEITKPLPPPPQSDGLEVDGICIRFPHGCTHAEMSRKKRLVHLQRTISSAVLDAGMSRSPGNKMCPEKQVNVHGGQGYKTPDALFCGTYGQLMVALEGAGLSATPSTGQDLSRYARLGAIFVARNDGASGVQLRKITLWG